MRPDFVISTGDNFYECEHLVLVHYLPCHSQTDTDSFMIMTWHYHRNCSQICSCFMCAILPAMQRGCRLCKMTSSGRHS